MIGPAIIWTPRRRKVRAKAPLRLGLGGGGTDVAPFSELFGGVVLNATISLYAHCTMELRDDGLVRIVAADLGKQFETPASTRLPVDNDLRIVCQVYNRVVRDFAGGRPFGVTITTSSDVPAGSGLGSSSTLVVAVLTAFAELLGLPLGEYEIAHLAFEIERVDLGLAGGKQDQYAATFGGFNLMEFSAEDRVIINPLRVRRSIISELEASLVLYYIGQSRDSAEIIERQVSQIANGEAKSIEALQELKLHARSMKEALLLGDVQGFGTLIRQGWEAKVRVADKITNNAIDETIGAAIAAGALGGKVSGAGGGGFIMLFVQPEKKAGVHSALAQMNGRVFHFNFTETGAFAWPASELSSFAVR